jgi:FKBP-type peptidyl-prolyl cis-trans isomerase
MKLKYTVSVSLLVIIAAVMFSCGDEKYPGYSDAGEGVYYKLHYPGESGKKAGEDDFYEVIMLNKFGEEVIYDSQLESGSGTLLMQSQASKYFNVLSEGDSATFLLSGAGLALPGMPDTGMIEMNVKVVRILSADEAADIESNRDADAGEVLIIKRYLARNGLKVEQDSSGIVSLEMNVGNGKSPEKGDTVDIQVKGQLLNGRIVDDSHSYGGLSFIWGDEGQVLPGIRMVLSRMKEGGNAKIILPSRLAFGSGGSSTGIVPANTPVLYTIELLHTR